MRTTEAPRARAYFLALPACMGGFCSHREHCGRHVTPHRERVVERLCERGSETPQPVFIVEQQEAS